MLRAPAINNPKDDLDHLHHMKKNQMEKWTVWLPIFLVTSVLERVLVLVLLLVTLSGVCAVGLLDFRVSDDARETLFIAFGGVATLNLDFATTVVAPNLQDFAAIGEVNKALLTLEFGDKA
ncbi:hypothetical protein Tco_0950945 [Tanacetum coccineum]|uniref:Uncharacterized protein n=1 Tax=Tanacetum coccineum TaxID=301880 RepID=A0ABQ5DSQ1_9ASTR